MLITAMYLKICFFIVLYPKGAIGTWPSLAVRPASTFGALSPEP